MRKALLHGLLCFAFVGWSPHSLAEPETKDESNDSGKQADKGPGDFSTKARRGDVAQLKAALKDSGVSLTIEELRLISPEASAAEAKVTTISNLLTQSVGGKAGEPVLSEEEARKKAMAIVAALARANGSEGASSNGGQLRPLSPARAYRAGGWSMGSVITGAARSFSKVVKAIRRMLARRPEPGSRDSVASGSGMGEETRSLASLAAVGAVRAPSRDRLTEALEFGLPFAVMTLLSAVLAWRYACGRRQKASPMSRRTSG